MSWTSSGLLTWLNHAARRAARRRPLIDRQVQLAQQALDLFPRHHMFHARASAECLIKVVKRGQATRIKFAIDLALGKSIDRAEAEPERQFIETVDNELLVA